MQVDDKGGGNLGRAKIVWGKGKSRNFFEVFREV